MASTTPVTDAHHHHEFKLSTWRGVHLSDLRYPGTAALLITPFYALSRRTSMGNAYHKVLIATSLLGVAWVIGRAEGAIPPAAEIALNNLLPIQTLQAVSSDAETLIASCVGATSGAVFGRHAMRSIFTHSMTAVALAPAAVAGYQYAKKMEADQLR